MLSRPSHTDEFVCDRRPIKEHLLARDEAIYRDRARTMMEGQERNRSLDGVDHSSDDDDALHQTLTVHRVLRLQL